MTAGFSRVLIVALGLAALACAAYAPPSGPPGSGPRAEVDLTFYDALAPYGEWLHVELYGWIWVPRAVPASWHPYTCGHWVYTSYGWTWVSDFVWGWAPFHYGRWIRHGHWGWAWVPGYVWAPAWVGWRWGEGWIGWAPLPPEARWSVGLGGLLSEPRLSVGWWVFLPERHLTDPASRTRIVLGDEEPGLVARTRSVTRYEAWGRDAVRERGLDPDAIERAAGVAVPRYRLEEAPAPPAVESRSTRRDRLPIYRPPVKAPEPQGKGRPVQRRPPGDGG